MTFRYSKNWLAVKPALLSFSKKLLALTTILKPGSPRRASLEEVLTSDL